MLIFVLTLAQACAPDRESNDDPVPGLEFLLGSEPLATPQATDVFTPPEHHLAPTNKLEGVLTLVPGTGSSQMEVLTDTFGFTTDETLRFKELPPYSVRIVTDGSNIIPLERGPQRPVERNTTDTYDIRADDFVDLAVQLGA